ncbi:MAG: thiamine phosphate synthase [Lentisphaeria bacterium]|nr:thiamine phosphate synthase [Lentisphaeria bacterium]
MKGSIMKSVRPDFLKLYAITDDGPNLVERVRLALEGGATCIQHRAKGASFEAAKADALAIQSLCREFDVPFIVNDSLELALAIGADGLHVGQSDTAAREARRALGPDAILGVSAATVAEALKAEQDGADYIGVGAVFPTSTKLDATCVTHTALRAICGAVDIPAVAIGGIHAGNLLQLEHSGIAGVSVVSAVFGAPDVKAAARELKSLVERADFTLPDETGMILDFDGTVLDSMQVWLGLAQDFLRANGAEPRPDLDDKLANCADLVTGAAYLQVEYGLKLTPEQTLQGLLDLLNARYMACQLKPGAEEFLREAGRRGYRMVIGTASDRKAVEAILAKHDLLDLFVDIITTGETGLDKKDPAFYWIALERLGTRRRETWLFDDAPFCIETAHSCGLRTAGVPDMFFSGAEFTCADLVLKRLDEWFKS